MVSTSPSSITTPLPARSVPSVSAVKASCGMIECRPTTEASARSRSKPESPARGWFAGGTFHSVKEAMMKISWPARPPAFGISSAPGLAANLSKIYVANGRLESLVLSPAEPHGSSEPNSASCEYQKAVSRNRQRGGAGKAVHGRTVRLHLASVAGDSGIDPVIVDVAVEYFEPVSGLGKADVIIIPRVLIQAAHDHDVVSDTFDPALKGEHAVLVMDVNDRAAFSAQGRMVAADADQFAGKAEKVAHRFVAATQAVPPDQRVRVRRVAPWLVLQDLLAHENKRNPRRGQQQPHRNPAAAARIPGAGVAAVGEPGDPRTAADVDDVVVFHRRNRAPAIGQAGAGDGIGNRTHRNLGGSAR